MNHSRRQNRYGVRLLRAAALLASLSLLMAPRSTPAFALSDRTTAVEPQNTAQRPGYVGNAVCISCHRQQGLTYLHTAHFLTSQAPRAQSILGSFTSPSNILWIARPATDTTQPRLFFQMDRKASGFYQTAVAELGSRKLTQSGRIDVVIGAGVRGQTYLDWNSDRLYELPVSYWTDGHQWINSPGYTDGTANFARRADPRCIECHASYIQALSPDPQTNLYRKDSLVLGISCETCHGPGALHVSLERGASPRGAAAILNPAHFSRDRQVDLCALCHNGTARQELLPAFSYIPGEPLDAYFAPAPLETGIPDVHSNQVGLLRLSLCYRDSPSMSCSTCHDVHAPERTAADYSNRCMACHSWKSCGEARKLGSAIRRDCVDCHMPMLQTQAIVSVTAGKVLHTSIRTHWIKIYPGTPVPQLVLAKSESAASR